jgi:outer membrane protein OmpA-like peptidoglycan-associated protein
MKNIMLFLLLTFSCLLTAQEPINFISNPSFEKSKVVFISQYDRGSFRTQRKAQFEKVCPEWITMEESTPDVIDTTQSFQWKDYGKIIFDKLESASGEKFVGMTVFGCNRPTTLHCREYLAQTLKEPLKKCHKYKIEISTMRLLNSMVISNLGFYFSDTLLDFKKFWAGLKLKPQVVFDSIIAKNPMQWVHLSDTFTATSNFKYVYFGNFFRDEACQTLAAIGEKTLPSSYYFFDDMSLTLVQAITCGTHPEAIKKVPEKFTVRDILFETNKADLKQAGYPFLDSIYTLVLSRNKTHLVITGHTDSQGSPQYNQQLSEKRASAIAQYFQTKGMVANRLITKGLGATQPISDNSSLEGRQRNRRVEIELMEE